MKTIHVVGARPQFIKIDVLCRTLTKYDREKTQSDDLIHGERGDM